MPGGAPAATVFSSFSNWARETCVLQSERDAVDDALAGTFPAAGLGAAFGRPLRETSQTPLIVITGVSAGTEDSAGAEGVAGGAAWVAVAPGVAGFGAARSLCAETLREQSAIARRKKMTSLKR